MSKQYRSPFAVLDLSPADVNPVTVRQARRRLLAEFELNNATVLLFGKVLCTRNDVERLADELLDEITFHFHYMVLSDAALRQFLDTGNAVGLRRGAPKTFGEHPGYAEFMRPFLLARLDQDIAGYFRAKGRGKKLPGHRVDWLMKLPGSRDDFPELEQAVRSEIVVIRSLHTGTPWFKEYFAIHRQFDYGRLQRFWAFPDAAYELHEEYFRSLIALLERASGSVINWQAVDTYYANIAGHLQSATLKQRLLRQLNVSRYGRYCMRTGYTAWSILFYIALIVFVSGFSLGNASTSILLFLFTIPVVPMFFRTFGRIIDHANANKVRHRRRWKWLICLGNVVAMPVYWYVNMRKGAGARSALIVGLLWISTVLLLSGLLGFLF